MAIGIAHWAASTIACGQRVADRVAVWLWGLGCVEPRAVGLGVGRRDSALARAEIQLSVKPRTVG